MSPSCSERWTVLFGMTSTQGCSRHVGMSACAPTAKSQNVAFDDSQIASIPIECVEGFQISDCWWVTGKPEVILPVPVKLGATIHLSNHALKSAKPILRKHLLFKHWCPSLTILVCQKPSVFSPIWISHDCAQWLQSALFCTVRAQQKKQLKYEFRKSLKVKKIGGRGRVRTGDPLLAKRAEENTKVLRWCRLHENPT